MSGLGGRVQLGTGAPGISLLWVSSGSISQFPLSQGALNGFFKFARGQLLLQLLGLSG